MGILSPFCPHIPFPNKNAPLSAVLRVFSVGFRFVDTLYYIYIVLPLPIGVERVGKSLPHPFIHIPRNPSNSNVLKDFPTLAERYYLPYTIPKILVVGIVSEQPFELVMSNKDSLP